ncbi:MAG: hypothetical protein VKO64_08740 [Candidatus Sericytochromatia bacterium]|nr:hypothetical protein [Candidatus Sericytochromatia bacterium]
MTCDDLRRAVHEQPEHSVLPEAAAREHLDACALCRAWSSSIRSTIRALETAQIPAMPLDFSRSLAPALVRARRERLARRWRWAAAVLVLIASTAGGWQIGRLLMVRESAPPADGQSTAQTMQIVPGQTPARVVPASLGR